MEIITQSSGIHELVQGLAAFILGICCRDNTDAVPSMSRFDFLSLFRIRQGSDYPFFWFIRASLQNIVVSRIGIAQFVDRMNRVRDNKFVLRAPSESEVRSFLILTTFRWSFLLIVSHLWLDYGNTIWYPSRFAWFVSGYGLGQLFQTPRHGSTRVSDIKDALFPC